MKKEHRYFVYILKCADGSYYVGLTNDLGRRLQEHGEGHVRSAYTYNRRPLDLVYQVDFNYINEAIAFEKQLKRWSRKKKEALIRGDWTSLKEYSKCVNGTSHKNYRASLSGFDSAQPDKD